MSSKSAIVLAMKTRWLKPAEETAWRNYRRMRTLLDLQLQRDLSRSAGLSEADYDVLSTLTEAEGNRWRSRDLAARLLWSPSRLTHQIGRMEQRGLVMRESCEDDRRGAMLILTDQGFEALAGAAPQHVEAVRENLIDLLSADEIATLNSIAQKVIAKISSAPSTEGNGSSA